MISDITRFETEKFGKFLMDTSAQDTADLVKEYFRYDGVEVRQNAQLSDMVDMLGEESIIIAPVNGSALRNPHFTAPGPAEHMVAVIGYDPQKKEFIVNDPGTTHGKSYRYAETVFYDAVRDYPTGNHMPIKKNEKTIIIVKKAQ